jgi:protease-4
LNEKILKQGSSESKIAVIRIDGIISDAPKRNVMGAELDLSMPVRLREELDKIRKDASVKALVIRIDSPGGGVSTCDIMYNEIVKFKKERKIPVIVEMVEMAASGGVYLAAAGDRIIANPTTVTGSIGVIAQLAKFKDLMDKIGVSAVTIKSGDKKDMGSPMRDMTPEERAIMQDVINSMYERFLSVILAGRKNLDEKKLRAFADGRIFTAQKALEYGLIDAIGYADDAIAEAEKSANITNATVVTYSGGQKYTPNIYAETSAQDSTLRIMDMKVGVLEESMGCRFLYQFNP